MARPQKDWYEAALAYDVEKDLEKRPDLLKRFGYFRCKFIKWCAIQRVSFEADIEEEVSEFEQQFINRRLYNVDNKAWKKLSKLVFERDNYTCQYCGQVGGRLEVDHIVPISKNGTNSLENLTTACRRCNRQKRNKDLEEFNRWRASK